MLKMPWLLSWLKIFQWNASLLENADFTKLKHFTGTCWFHWKFQWKAGRQAVQEACAPGCMPASASLAPCSPGSCSFSFLTPQPGLCLNSGVAGGRETWSGGVRVPSQSLLSIEEKVCYHQQGDTDSIWLFFFFFYLHITYLQIWSYVERIQYIYIEVMMLLLVPGAFIPYDKH